jgi:prevent-host-death family protein
MAGRRKTVGVRELRQNLSVHLTRVKNGQTLTVTEHGQPVAELRPLSPDSDALATLIAEGRVTPAKRKPSGLPRPLRLPLDRPLTALLDELRQEGR